MIKETMRPVYTTTDGTEFTDKNKAMEYEETYEQSLLEKFDIKQLAKYISKYCATHNCEACPFYSDTGCVLEVSSVAYWEENIF